MRGQIDQYFAYGKGYKKNGLDENTNTDKDIADESSEYDDACNSPKKKRGRKQVLKNKKVNKYNLTTKKS